MCMVDRFLIRRTEWKLNKLSMFELTWRNPLVKLISMLKN